MFIFIYMFEGGCIGIYMISFINKMMAFLGVIFTNEVILEEYLTNKGLIDNIELACIFKKKIISLVVLLDQEMGA